MFFSGFFCGFERCGSAAFPNFRGGVPRRLWRRKRFGLMQEYCTNIEQIGFFGGLGFAKTIFCLEKV
jgi:hypothetical protein